MKRFVVNQEQYGKLFLIGTTLLVWAVILVLFNTYGYHETWKLWRVPAKAVFLDFQLIPASAESFQNGFEPTIENPYDPEGRIFNYPAFWRLFFYTGITREDTVWMGVCMNILFLAGVFLFPKKISVVTAIGMLFVIFSPASMLLYERGNVDLIVFFICTLVVVALRHSTNLATLLIAAGTIIKLFPFFGVSVLLQESKRKFWLLFGICSLVLVVYMAVTSSSVDAAWNLTMRGDKLSYGTNVFVARFEDTIRHISSGWLSSVQIRGLLKYGSLFAGLVFLFIMVLFAVRNANRTESLPEQNLAAFRMGASIYVGTFMLGNNWDYRLAFLVLVVPQLIEWNFSSDPILGWMARFCMVAVYLSCWHFIAWFSSYFTSDPDRLKLLFIFDELANWTLMGGFAYLLTRSAPEWLKTQFTTLLPKMIRPHSKFV